MTTPQVFEGLSGVLVAKTELSSVEGETGRLSVRGHRIEALVSAVPFEAMVALLLDGALPDASAQRLWQERLGAARVSAHARLLPRFQAVQSQDAMTTLRSALSLLEADATVADVLGMAAVASAAWI